MHLFVHSTQDSWMWLNNFRRKRIIKYLLITGEQCCSPLINLYRGRIIYNTKFTNNCYDCMPLINIHESIFYHLYLENVKSNFLKMINRKIVRRICLHDYTNYRSLNSAMRLTEQTCESYFTLNKSNGKNRVDERKNALAWSSKVCEQTLELWRM